MEQALRSGVPPRPSGRPPPFLLRISASQCWLGLQLERQDMITVPLPPRYARTLMALIVAWHQQAQSEIKVAVGSLTADELGAAIGKMPGSKGPVTGATAIRYVSDITVLIREAVRQHHPDSKVPDLFVRERGYRIAPSGISVLHC